ncbi:MAG: universal stress protein [Planctomycetota bacterium]|jgi:nucleotide-binding universal stress UspA family protein
MDLEIQLRRILVPTDLSDHSEHAFRHAAALARTTGAELIVLHVVEKFMDHSVLYSDVWPFQKPIKDYYRELEERTARHLEKKLRESVGNDLSYRVTVATGIPAAEIALAASREEVDLLVIATHGRGGIAQALLGSTTERVLRKASCPVLVVRSGETGFVRPAKTEA